ncbi:hypothetical protein [Pseudomonas sp. BN515]|uniref:hypothetical protein n=1 Tax=Pseudomonas sp. BN515 TaxID=2567892 RepID=UPI002454D86A|nr:hypothetical protein [Pseudomonas sp. BN515]MDH4869731.1 hypothetical protein [Pseudomonas sp. BN515]
MKKPTQQHAAGLVMAKEVVTREGTCVSDLPAMLETLINEAIASPVGRPALMELFDLVRELRKAGATTSPSLHKTEYERGIGFALVLVLKRIKALR